MYVCLRLSLQWAYSDSIYLPQCIECWGKWGMKKSYLLQSVRPLCLTLSHRFLFCLVFREERKKMEPHPVFCQVFSRVHFIKFVEKLHYSNYFFAMKWQLIWDTMMPFVVVILFPGIWSFLIVFFAFYDDDDNTFVLKVCM